jgi:hypothetical protein
VTSPRQAGSPGLFFLFLAFRLARHRNDSEMMAGRKPGNPIPLARENIPIYFETISFATIYM